jgi:hypothetical protein
MKLVTRHDHIPPAEAIEFPQREIVNMIMTDRIKRNLMRRAVDWPSPHVRRVAELIGVAIDGLNKLHVEDLQEHGRQIWFKYNGIQYRAAYRHPGRMPRRRGALVIYRADSPSRILVTIGTMAEAIAFHRRPRIT